ACVSMVGRGGRLAPRLRTDRRGERDPRPGPRGRLLLQYLQRRLRHGATLPRRRHRRRGHYHVCRVRTGTVAVLAGNAAESVSLRRRQWRGCAALRPAENPGTPARPFRAEPPRRPPRPRRGAWIVSERRVVLPRRKRAGPERIRI